MKKKAIILSLLFIIIFIVSIYCFYFLHYSSSTRLYHKVLFYNQLLFSKTPYQKINAKLESNHTFWQSPLKLYPYIFQEGDTVWDIHRKTGIRIDSIISINNLSNASYINIGKIIYLPNVDGILVNIDQLNKKNNISQQENWKIITNISYRQVLSSNIFQSNNTNILDVIQETYNIHARKLYLFNQSNNLNFLPFANNSLFLPGGFYTFSEQRNKIGSYFSCPLKETWITSVWGYRIHPILKNRSFHKGIDLGGSIGTKIYAARRGKVITATYSQHYGNLVIIQHRKYTTRYAHLNTIYVKRGQIVNEQTSIGELGKTGRTTGSHLHFEIREGKKSINPINLTKINLKKK